MSATETTIRAAKQFIGGEWIAAADGRTFEDRDPYTGDVIAEVPAGSREDAARPCPLLRRGSGLYTTIVSPSEGHRG